MRHQQPTSKDSIHDADHSAAATHSAALSLFRLYVDCITETAAGSRLPRPWTRSAKLCLARDSHLQAEERTFARSRAASKQSEPRGAALFFCRVTSTDEA